MCRGLMAILAFHVGAWTPTETPTEAIARGLGFKNGELEEALLSRGGESFDALKAALADLVKARNQQTDLMGALSQLSDELPLELKERLSLPATFQELPPTTRP